MKVRSQWDSKKTVTYEKNNGELITDRSQAQKASDIIQRVITGRSADVHVYNDDVDRFRNVDRFDLYDRLDYFERQSSQIKPKDKLSDEPISSVEPSSSDEPKPSDE